MITLPQGGEREIKIISYSLTSQLGPVYPAAQSHVYESTPSAHVPPLAQGLGTQSLMSKTQLVTFHNNTMLDLILHVTCNKAFVLFTLMTL